MNEIDMEYLDVADDGGDKAPEDTTSYPGEAEESRWARQDAQEWVRRSRVRALELAVDMAKVPEVSLRGELGPAIVKMAENFHEFLTGTPGS